MEREVVHLGMRRTLNIPKDQCEEEGERRHGGESFSRYQVGAGHSRMQTSAAKGSEHEKPENKAAEELHRALHCIAGARGTGQTVAETSDLKQLLFQCGEIQKKQASKCSLADGECYAGNKGGWEQDS